MTNRELLAEIERYLVLSGLTVAQFGTAVANDRALVRDLRKGRQLREANVEKVAKWMADHPARQTIAS